MSIQYELRSKPPTDLLHEDTGQPWDQDASQLTRLGKRPVLKVCTRSIVACLLEGSVWVMNVILLSDLKKLSVFVVQRSENADHPQRTFGFLSLLGFSCTVLVTWEGTLL